MSLTFDTRVLNSLENLEGLQEVVEELVEHPDKVEWFDFSFNQLKTIDEVHG